MMTIFEESYFKIKKKTKSKTKTIQITLIERSKQRARQM